MAECTYFIYNVPVGKLTIASNGQAITHVSFGMVTYPGERRATALTNRAANQIQEYFAGRRRYFELPLAPAGTDFQKKVWAETADIPYGCTKTYGEIATGKSCRRDGGKPQSHCDHRAMPQGARILRQARRIRARTRCQAFPTRPRKKERLAFCGVRMDG